MDREESGQAELMRRLILILSGRKAILLGFLFRGSNQSCINRWITGWASELVLYCSANRP